MTLLEQIEEQLRVLPPEKQEEVLDFITFLQQRMQATRSASPDEERGTRIKAALQQLAELARFERRGLCLGVKNNARGQQSRHLRSFPKASKVDGLVCQKQACRFCDQSCRSDWVS